MIDSDAEAIATIIRSVNWERRCHNLQTIIEATVEADDYPNEQLKEYVTNAIPMKDIIQWLYEHEANELLKAIRDKY